MNQNKKKIHQKILLVEHNVFIRDALRGAFELKGFTVVAAVSADEGLKKVKSNKFDIIIADYELPDLNGLEFFLLAGRFNSDSLKIILTIYGDIEKPHYIEKYGIDYALEKPFRFEEILKIIIKRFP
jgi:DNA-binding response OmpR family regulator